MHGGVKFYRGSAAAARTYVEADRSRVDDYYLADGTGLATRYVAGPITWEEREGGTHPGHEGERAASAVRSAGTLDGPAYEQWVAGYDIETGAAKGRLRTDDRALRFVEVVVNGPKTWSLAASLHPEIAAAYDAAQERAAQEVIGWLANHVTTRAGPRGRQVQVPVEKLEAAVVRHYTSRAGDPHRHLHLQINARVLAAGRWRGLHSVGVVDSIEAINGIGTAAMMCDPEFRRVLAAYGYTLDPSSEELRELAPYAGEFSARAGQIARNVDRYEARWRRDHPGEEPGPKLRRGWDRRAWSDARPDKVVPTNGAQLAQRWVDELHALGFTPPVAGVELRPTAIGRINRDAVVDVALTRIGARRSSWNAADIRGHLERIVASVDVVTDPAVRRELAEDLTARAVERCVPLLDRDDVPTHVRSLTSREVLGVEADLVRRLVTRAEKPGAPRRTGATIGGAQLDPDQQRVAAALAGTSTLLVVEGAAGAGKTTTLRAARHLVEMGNERLVIVTPTLKAARVAEEQVGTAAYSAAWFVHQHGFRWDADGRWSRIVVDGARPNAMARLLPGDLLLIDEAGMLDQDTARALLTVADESSARIAFVGDRHQLPAVGRGGVLDHAARWSATEAHLELEAVHRFSDPAYADLTLLMRTGERANEVFDALLERGEIVIHPTEIERLSAVVEIAHESPTNSHVIADTREQVAALNAAVRDRQMTDGGPATRHVTTRGGEHVSVGDRISTRRNDRDLGVANRDQWTVTGVDSAGHLAIDGRRGPRTLPAEYARAHVELAYATTAHGAQGDTVEHAHLVVGETTGAAAAYVGMTRGRHRNTAHLVAASADDARAQWIEVFSRDRADLGPAHAAEYAAESVDRYGSQPPQPTLGPDDLRPSRRHPEERAPFPTSSRPRGIGR
ncbi:MAG: AAA family ATPase [Actinomycetota bacterium]|nr:AAA family ATPase [Actinomycetota bacterium]